MTAGEEQRILTQDDVLKKTRRGKTSKSLCTKRWWRLSKMIIVCLKKKYEKFSKMHIFKRFS
jgi:hypothetical protein